MSIESFKEKGKLFFQSLLKTGRQDPVHLTDYAADLLDDSLSEAAQTILSSPKIALTCHVNPDADALGSMLALAETLQSAGKEVVCSWSNEPLILPHWLELIGEMAPIIPPKLFPDTPKLMLALDAASPRRLGLLAEHAMRADTLIMIDHHISNNGFGKIMLWDATAAATAEIVFRLIERMGLKLSSRAAACLYAGLITDSGRFQYEATTPATLHIAAELRRYTFDHARLAQLLFENESYEYLKIAGIALSRSILLPDVGHGLIWTYLIQEDLIPSGLALKDTDSLIDLLRTTCEADVSCVIKQQRSGFFSISLRSHGATDVAKIAGIFGGGGHPFAAGYTSRYPLQETVRMLIDAIPHHGDIEGNLAA